MNRKAALELSINAIVVLILAITILGLGIGFIKTQFGGLQKQFSGVSKEIESQLLEKLRTSGELLSFNQEEVEAKIGKIEKFYIGIKNTQSPAPDNNAVCFGLQIKCLRSLTQTGTCSEKEGVQQGDTVGGLDLDGTKRANWFTVFEQVDIKEGEVGVYPISLQIAKAKADTYLLELAVLQDSQNHECKQATGVWNPFQDKQFFVVLS